MLCRLTATGPAMLHLLDSGCSHETFNIVIMKNCNVHYGDVISSVKRELIGEIRNHLEKIGGEIEWQVPEEDECLVDDCLIVACNPDGYDPTPMDVCIEKISVLGNGAIYVFARENGTSYFIDVDIEDVFVEHLVFILEAILKREKLGILNKALIISLYGKIYDL